MKKTLLLAVCMVLVASAAFAGTVVGSKHDLSTGVATITGANDEICVFCHTPHNASSTPLAPLWSHTSTTVASYTLYANTFGTLNGTTGQPGNISKACLSCHDATVAVGSVANGFYAGSIDPGAHDSATDYAAGAVMTGDAALGTDLSNDHPVGITYNAAADGALNAIVGNLVGVLPVYPASGNFTVECGSCHNVHNPVNVPFLRIPNTQSDLCLECHIK